MKADKKNVFYSENYLVALHITIMFIVLERKTQPLLHRKIHQRFSVFVRILLFIFQFALTRLKHMKLYKPQSIYFKIRVRYKFNRKYGEITLTCY